MKLSRPQELKLIDLGLAYLINEFDINKLIGKRVTIPNTNHNPKQAKRKSKFTKAQREAISRRMKKMWRDKRVKVE